MGLFSNSKDAITEHKAAKADLEQVSKRDRAETEDYHRANQRVADTEQNVSWFRR